MSFNMAYSHLKYIKNCFTSLLAFFYFYFLFHLLPLLIWTHAHTSPNTTIPSYSPACSFVPIARSFAFRSLFRSLCLCIVYTHLRRMHTFVIYRHRPTKFMHVKEGRKKKQQIYMCVINFKSNNSNSNISSSLARCLFARSALSLIFTFTQNCFIVYALIYKHTHTHAHNFLLIFSASSSFGLLKTIIKWKL